MAEHEKDVAEAFDRRAEAFQTRPVQSDPVLLAWLLQAADLPPGSLVLDAGCGPGLVSEALLAAGHRVVGVDLSAGMIERARARCGRFGNRATFHQQSIAEALPEGPFDAVLSRFVVHHVPDALAFMRRQVELVRPGGVVVACDHTTTPDEAAAAWQHDLESRRDHTHTRSLSPGQLLDTLAAAGLSHLWLVEHPFMLDFDEWFDAGTPVAAKAEVRQRLLSGQLHRSFRPEPLSDGRVRIHGWLAVARGVRPLSPVS
jgi:SAM-dependent methyltransferase